jgi:hypothetical protein
VHIVECLIDFEITEIEHPLNIIPENTPDDVSEPDEFSKEEEFKSGSKDMDDNNDHDG